MPWVLRRQFDGLIVKCMSTLFFLAAVSISQGRRRGWQLGQQLTPQVLRLPVKDPKNKKRRRIVVTRRGNRNFPSLLLWASSKNTCTGSKTNKQTKKKKMTSHCLFNACISVYHWIEILVTTLLLEWLLFEGM